MDKIVFTPGAIEDYHAATAWYFARSEKVAYKFDAALAAALERILATPELYALVDPHHRRGLLRRFPYSIIYRVRQDDILVLAVAHSRRSSSFWKKRG